MYNKGRRSKVSSVKGRQQTLEARVIKQLRNEAGEKIDLIKTKAQVREGSIVKLDSYELRYWKLDKESNLVDLHTVPLWPHELVAIAEVILGDKTFQDSAKAIWVTLEQIKEGDDDDAAAARSKE